MFEDACYARGFAENDQLAAQIRDEYQSFPRDIRDSLRAYMATLAALANDRRLAPVGRVEVHFHVRSSDDGDITDIPVSPNMLSRCFEAWDNGDGYIPGNAEV